jgi:hypothetical protein
VVPLKALRAAVAICAICTAPSSRGQQATTAKTVEIDGNDIGGTVTGSTGPEAGVWVICPQTMTDARYLFSASSGSSI